MKPVDMPVLVENLVEDARWLNQIKQHELRTHITQGIGVFGIETELKSACANLLSNAIAYTPASGIIDVSWRRNGDKVIFSVKDNGDGIKADQLNRLTERFYRIDKSRSRDTGGSGLGLGIIFHSFTINHHDDVVISTIKSSAMCSKALIKSSKLLSFIATCTVALNISWPVCGALDCELTSLIKLPP